MIPILRRGATGFEVRRVQGPLVELKYLTKQPDGIFDAATEFAVQMYQQANGLKPDGIVGPITRAKMFPGEATRDAQERSIVSPYIETVLSLFKKYENVRETGGPNRGPEIDRWLRELGIPKGNPWCLAMIQGVFAEAAVIHSVPDPLKPNTASCLALWRGVDVAWKYGRQEGRRGDIGVMQHSKTTGHVYVVASYQGGIYESWEGNTNRDGSRDGDRVAHKFTRQYNDPKLLGFVRVPDPLAKRS